MDQSVQNVIILLVVLATQTLPLVLKLVEVPVKHVMLMVLVKPVKMVNT